MTAPLPAARRGQHRGPWTIDDDALLLDFVRQCGRLVPISGRAAPAAVALAAELIVSLGRTASAIDTRIRGLRDRSKIGTQGAYRSAAALRGVVRAAAAEAGDLPEPPPRPAAQTPRPPPVPLPEPARQGRDYGPRPACAPPRELWTDATGDGIDPWRVACYLRSTRASAEAIAQQLGERCDPRCAPTREVVRGAWRGKWTAADVRRLLGE
jgi:hypothetical protein